MYFSFMAWSVGVAIHFSFSPVTAAVTLEPIRASVSVRQRPDLKPKAEKHNAAWRRRVWVQAHAGQWSFAL